MIYPFSIHPFSYDVSVFVVFYYVPLIIILEFTYILSTISPRVCSFTMIFPILPFPYILHFPFILPFPSVSQNTKTIWFPILYLTFIYMVSVFIPKSQPFVIMLFSPPIKSFPFMIITNHRRRKKKEGEDDEYMSHLVSYKWICRTQYITSIGLIYKNRKFYLEGV